jgi:hypothetical protein
MKLIIDRQLWCVVTRIYWVEFRLPPTQLVPLADDTEQGQEEEEEGRHEIGQARHANQDV